MSTYALARKRRQRQLYWLPLAHMMVYVGEKLVFPAPCRELQFSINDDGTRRGFTCHVFAKLFENVEDGKGDTNVFNLYAELERHGSSVWCLFDFCRNTLRWDPIRRHIFVLSGDLSDGHACVLGWFGVDAGKLA